LIVADSSVLIHLAAIGRLDLLRGLFERLTLPPAVWREVVEEGSGRPGAREIESGLYQRTLATVGEAAAPGP